MLLRIDDIVSGLKRPGSERGGADAKMSAAHPEDAEG